MTAFDITPLQIPIGGPIPEITGKLSTCKIACKSMFNKKIIIYNDSLFS